MHFSFLYISQPCSFNQREMICFTVVWMMSRHDKFAIFSLYLQTVDNNLHPRTHFKGQNDLEKLKVLQITFQRSSTPSFLKLPIIINRHVSPNCVSWQERTLILWTWVSPDDDWLGRLHTEREFRRIRCYTNLPGLESWSDLVFKVSTSVNWMEWPPLAVLYTSP